MQKEALRTAVLLSAIDEALAALEEQNYGTARALLLRAKRQAAVEESGEGYPLFCPSSKAR